MIYNPKITTEYGTFKIIPIDSFIPPVFKPTPLPEDYQLGYISRTFILKHSDGSGKEIDPNLAKNVSQDSYSTYSFNWRISGYRYLTKTGSLVIDYGVEPQNRQELARVGSADGVNLQRFFPNLIEFWRGH